MPGIPADLMWTTAVTTITGLVVTAMYRKLGAYTADSARWRKQVDGQLDALANATQTTMRTDLIHTYEKYVTRGWITPEERAAWHDMHAKYSKLNANGLIDSYARRLEALPDREIN